jgi:hypothetical protein
MDQGNIKQGFSMVFSQFVLVGNEFDGELDLSLSNFEIVPRCIGEARKLTKLDLSNSLFSQLPAEIGDLTSLETLNLSNNDNLQAVPRTLAGCTALTTVIIKDCEYSTKILKSLDAAFGERSVSWKDRPPVLPKLLIKLFVCASLLAMSVFTIIQLIIGTEDDDGNVEDDTDGLELFKTLDAVLSLIFLVPHAVDVGTMMDQFLQVSFKVKVSAILDRQDKIADRIQMIPLLKYTIFGIFGSLANLLCLCWCTRESPEAGLDGGEAVDEDEEKDVPHSLEVCCFPSRYASRFASRDNFAGVTPFLLFVMIVEWVDTIQTLSLFPLSWFIITDSGNSVIDVLVNVVAVSVFVLLDDEVVEMLTKPQQSLLEWWRLYSGSEEDLRRSGIIEIKAPY